MINKTTRLFLILNFFVSSGFTQQVNKATTGNNKVVTDLYKEILYADSALFHAFNTCDTLVYKNYFTEDLEFYHDTGGLTVSLKSELQSFTDNCKTDLHLRRELVKTSLEIYPIKDYGAIQIGTHRFYHTDKEGVEKLNGTYKFIHVWQKKNGTWKIARVISYGHN